MANKDKIRRFLNKECIWVLNDASCTKKKVYSATVAKSPFLEGLDGIPDNDKFYQNVTALIMKPKDALPCVTVFLSGAPIVCSNVTTVSIQQVPGTQMFLIYFGEFIGSPAMPIPMDPSIPCTKGTYTEPGWTDIVNSAMLTEHASGGSGAFTPISPFCWYEPHKLCEYVIHKDCMVMIPTLPVFPSMTKIITAMTRCENLLCAKCAGYRRHATVRKGFTCEASSGTSIQCPCSISCNLKNGSVPILKNANLLSLLFDPVVAPSVKSLHITQYPSPRPLDDIIYGVTNDGKRVNVESSSWNLVTLSDIQSQIYITGCKKIKKKCLHSY
ncbi:hypothetical protein RHVP.33 [Cricetid gammaherpesvirus 2]|uniref:Uncharacterized protein n=1 Tax=Cricetid gammaherpesvirus 2 TaxID=1605972 RepID=E9M5L6_9GAMA|nr:hypothetical protein RHVP.33 [Cricetid gammaherpesvirus 2]ADW24374.1 hypothetical protein RHVP.33 [Cricetid gammaherpesvirus 2]ADW24456.1 hypothetical protein RHVP-L.33 [Cricetid gammaherpesvirus 2]